MTRSRRYRPPRVQTNMTSMLDVVFLLIIFFILATNFAAKDVPPLDTPDPVSSLAEESEKPHARVINLMPDPNRPLAVSEVLLQGGKGSYPMTTEGMAALTESLIQMKQRLPALEIDLRAEKSLPYESVRPVMSAISSAGIYRVNLVAQLQRGGATP